MSHTIIKITINHDGEEVESPKWCLSVNAAGEDATFCTGEYFGNHDSDCTTTVKHVERGGITCPDCLQKIKAIKAIRL